MELPRNSIQLATFYSGKRSLICHSEANNISYACTKEKEVGGLTYWGQPGKEKKGKENDLEISFIKTGAVSKKERERKVGETKENLGAKMFQ